MATRPKYPAMEKYLVSLMNPGSREIVGREEEAKQTLATLNRPETANGMLLGPAGTGKTTLAYKVAQMDPDHKDYYAVQVPLMKTGGQGQSGSVEMAVRMTHLVHQVQQYQRETGRKLVLFIDEFHQLITESNDTAEALKPLLANSGQQNIRILAATTYEEFNRYVRPNDPLTQRFALIPLPTFTFEQTVTALQGMMKIYMPDQYVDNRLIREIVEATDRALPSDSQPRKSLKVLDGMIGWYRTWGGKFDQKLLADQVKKTLGVDINYQVNAAKMEKQMNARVFDQTLATRAVTDRLYISVAGLNDPTRPRGSFLFTGPTGVGKTELAKTMATLLFGSESEMIRFDMSEYSTPESVNTLRSRLTDEVREHPSSVVLLDEIEKAAAPCTRLMLQVLDDARLTDNLGHVISFKETYIVFTTNAGAKTFEDIQQMYQSDLKYFENMSDEQIQERQRRRLKDYMPLIMRALGQTESKFPPELLGRIDQIVPFAGIEVKTRYKICRVQLDKLSKMVYQKHSVHLHIDQKVYDFIVQEHLGANSTKSGGGREVKRRIDENVTSRVAQALVQYPDIRDLAVIIRGKLSYNQKFDKEGSAYVYVGRWNG